MDIANIIFEAWFVYALHYFKKIDFGSNFGQQHAFKIGYDYPHKQSIYVPCYSDGTFVFLSF